MRYTGTERDDDAPWFSLGQLEVTTATFVVLGWVVTLIIFAIEGLGGPINTALVLSPWDVTSGEIWRVVTWPWAHLEFSLFDIISAALFWIFGTDLEKQLGRRPFAKLLASSILIIGLADTAWSELLSGTAYVAGMELLLLTVLLLYVAEHPTRPFFFGIPAWMIGGVIVAIEVINDLASRDWSRLLTIIVAAALIALVARTVGLLTMYDRVPELALPGRRRKSRDGDGGGFGTSSAPKPSRSPRTSDEAKRPGRLWGRGEEPGPAEIVQMPPQRPRPVDTRMPDLSADDIALDLLLDKIADGGLDALTPQERQSLDELRARRRGGGTPPA